MSTPTQMVDPIKGNGQMVNNMVKVFSLHLKGSREKEFGRMERECDGLTKQATEKETWIEEMVSKPLMNLMISEIIRYWKLICNDFLV